MAKIEITTEVIDIPQHKDKISYRIDNPTATFYDSDQIPSDKIEKTFIKKQDYKLLRFGEDRNSNIVSNYIDSGFDGEVKDFVVIPARNNRPRLIAIIGEFNGFSQTGNNQSLNGFAIIESPEDATPLPNTPIPFYFADDSIFDLTSTTLNTIDYDPTADELAIGGSIRNINNTIDLVSNIVFFSVGVKQINLSKTFNVVDSGGIQGTINTLKYRQGNQCIVGGTFKGAFGNPNISNIAGISPVGGSLTFFNDYNEGADNAVLGIDKTLSGNIYIVGDFDKVRGEDRDGLASLNYDGSLTPFNILGEFSGGKPSAVAVEQSTSLNNQLIRRIYVGGDFNKFNGEDTGSIVAFNSNGTLYTPFNAYNEVYGQEDITRLHARDGILSVAINNPTTGTNPGFIVDMRNAEIIEELFLDDGLNYIYSLSEGDRFYGGKFVQYDNNSYQLTNQDILIDTTSLTTLAEKIKESYQNESTNINSLYTRSAEKVLHEYYHYTINPTVESIEDIPGVIKISVEYYDSDGNPISLISSRLCLLRSDYIIRSKEGQFDYTKFTVKTKKLSGLFQLESIINPPIITRVDKQMLEGQKNTWINVSPLVDKQDILVDYEVLNKYLVSSDKLTETLQGKFGEFIAQNIVDQEIVDTRKVNSLVLNGFKDENVSETIIPNILMNGRYRELTQGSYIKIPIYMKQVDKVLVRGTGGQVIEEIDITTLPNYNSNTDSIGGVINYFKLAYNDYPDKYIRLEFTGGGNLRGTVNIVKRKTNCLTGKSDIIFVNRYGLLEHTQMVGLHKVGYKTRSDEYQISIRDIDGNMDTTKHKYQTFNKGGEEIYNLNTGIIRDKMNRVYEDLIFSEEIWIKNGNKIIPVVLEDTTFEEKYNLEGNQVEYTFRFKEANNKVRNDI